MILREVKQLDCEVQRGAISGILSSNHANCICYDNLVGGLIGGVSSNVTNCYAACVISNMGSSEVGGLLGYFDYCTVTNSYYDFQVSGQSDTGKGEPRTTAQIIMLWSKAKLRNLALVRNKFIIQIT